MNDNLKRILVIDDDRDMRDLAMFTLSFGGYEVCGASNGLEGLELAREINPHLIITDWQMARMTGVEMCQRLKESEDLHCIPVILKTKASKQELLDKGIDIDMFDNVWDSGEPIGPDRLLARVENQLSLEMQEPSISIPNMENQEINDASIIDNPEKSEDTIEFLYHAFSSTDHKVRGKAVFTLSARYYIGDSLLRKTPAQETFWRNVFHSLTSSSITSAIERWENMSEVALALTKAPDEQNAMLRRLAAEGATEEIQVTSIKALGLNRDAQAADILLKAADSDVNKIRSTAIRALGSLGEERGIAIAARATEDKSLGVRYAAINTLAAIGTREAVDVLKDSLGRKDYKIRIDVVKALTRAESRVPENEAFDILSGRIEVEEHNDVLYSIASSLANLRSQDVEPTLKKLLSHPSHHVQKGAQEAMNKIGKQQ